ncbi:Tn3 family transposase [Burkholderia sp. R-70199]|nr:Tn3 family transposase [Burkholderia sp. R-70199]
MAISQDLPDPLRHQFGIPCQIAVGAQSCTGDACCAADDPHRKILLALARHHDPLAAVSSALALLFNAVMAWNTIHMQRAVDGIEAMGGQPVQTRDLRRISKSINLRGASDFPIGRFTHHLLPGVADLNAKQRRLARTAVISIGSARLELRVSGAGRASLRRAKTSAARAEREGGRWQTGSACCREVF